MSKLTITALYSAVKECRLKPAEDSIQQHGIPKSTKKTTDYLVLQTALDKNHKHIAKLLINVGCRINPNENDKDNGWTPLAWAIIRANIEIAMLLLNKGASSEAGNKSGLTVLHLAVRKKSLNMIRLVLCFMSVNLIDNKGRTVLQTFFQVVCNQHNIDQAGMINNAKILDLLLKKGASLNFQNDPYGYTPMHYAVKSKQIDLINRLIHKTGNVNVQSNGETPLHVLLSEKNNFRSGALDIVRLLVHNGANVNIPNNQKETLLHVILSRCHSNEEEFFEVIQFLVEQGANINVQNHRSESACHLAAKKKCFRVLHLFLQHQCQINLEDYEHNTILHRLLQNSRSFRTNDAFIEIVNKVLALGPSLDIRNAEEETPLDLTVQNMQSPRLLRRMLAENVNVNAIDKCGNTILHNFLIDLMEKNCAVDDDHIELIEILSVNGANVDLANKDNKTPIHLVFDLGKKNCNKRINIYNMLLSLLNYTNNLNITDKNDKPILHIMSSLKKPFTEAEDKKAAEIVDVYLTKGAEVDLKDSAGLTALCMAATNRQQYVVKVLLDHSADFNAYLPTSQATILECLLRMKNHSVEDVEIAGALLFHGAEIDESPDSEFSILHYVTLPNKFEMCSKLIAHSKNINIVDNQGNTALHNLLRCQYDIDDITESRVCKVATELVLKGDLINSKNIQGLTPLHLSVKHQLYEVTKDLLKCHANPTAQDNAGNCALHFLGIFKFKNSLNFVKKMVKLLIEAGCDVNTSNNDGITPLLATVYTGRISLVQVLIKFKADMNLFTNANSFTPLHVAVENNQTEIAEYLIKCGADVNAKRSDGWTALHIAVNYDANIIVENLLKNGADPNMKDNDGRTAIFLACSFSIVEAIKELLNYGADINLADNSGSVPMDFVNGTIKTILLNHIKKLRAADIFVSHENLRIDLINDALYCEFEKEVKQLKEIKINNQKSLADVLKMSQRKLTIFKNNEDFQKHINSDDFEEQFPHYAKLLKACYITGLIRSNLLVQAKISFRELLEMPLPDICCDLMFSFLSNDSLQEVVTAARLKSKMQKRRREDHDDCDVAHPPAKRLRRLSV